MILCPINGNWCSFEGCNYCLKCERGKEIIMKRRDIMNKLLKSKYDVVLDILAKYDPVGLADLCGRDEYSIEAIDIANRAGVLEVDDLAEWCKEVFLFWFSKYGNTVNWHDMAAEIKEKIS